MIVKIPEQRQFSNESNGQQQQFDDLVKYLLEKFGLEQTTNLLLDRYGLKTNDEIVLPGFTDILTYAAGDLSIDGPTSAQNTTDDTSPGKCLSVEVHGVSHLASATAEMNAVAANNTRVKDAAYHFILSWPEHEKPEPAKIFDAARHALRALNLHEHQYVLAIHGNTDNMHCHVAVNRVHPVTFASQHLSFAKDKLHKAARESEIKHGWSNDNGIFIVEIDDNGNKSVVKNPEIGRYSDDAYNVGSKSTTRSQATVTTSPWTDPDSLINWTRAVVLPVLKSALPGLSSWQDLHQFLSQYEISLKDTGGGGMRLTAVDPKTGEVLDIAASKALRILKRTDLETRWGKFQPAITPATPSDQTKPRSTTHAKNIAHFDQFDRFGPHPESAARRQRMHELRGEHVDGDEDRSEMLLPRDAPDHMEHTETDLDTSVRRRSGGGRTITASPNNDHPGDPAWTPPHSINRSPPARRPVADPFQFDTKRDPLKRAQRKEERAEQRIALRRRFQQYREAIAETKLAHDARKAELAEIQRQERQTQKEAFYAEKLLHRKSPTKTISTPEQPDATPICKQDSHFSATLTTALLAANHATSKLAMATRHQHQRNELQLTRLPALNWRDWLHEQAQLGDQPALSALRGIVYQARRDAKLTVTPENPPVVQLPVDHTSTTTGHSSTLDPDTVAYLAFIAKLQEDEKRERAIRSANANQARPYQCDALLIQAAHMTYRVTDNGNVRFFDRTDTHLYTDRGNRITFDRETVTDNELRLALLHAREKFGNKLTLTGDDPIFTARMAKMADDLGMQVLNPDLRPLIAAHQANKRQLEIASRQRPLQPTQSPQIFTEPTSPAPATPVSSVSPSPETATNTPTIQTIHSASLPTETTDERLRQSILAKYPRITFVTVDPNRNEPYIGKIIGTEANCFAQRIGRNTVAIHRHAVPENKSHDTSSPVHIKYRDGKPNVIQTPNKAKTRSGR